MPDLTPTPSATSDWLHQFYGTAETGYLTLFSVDRITGTRHVDWSSVDDIATLAAAATHRSSNSCVWFGVATRKQNLGPRRGGAADCHAIPGLWIDIDCAGPGHRQAGRLARDVTHARQLVDSFPLPPTVVINSGGGLQAWWLFPELAEVDDSTNRLLASWGATWARLGEAIDIDPDNVFDVARVMRLPGTTNRKEGLARPVTIIDANWTCRYGADDIDQHLDAPPAPPAYRRGSGLPYIGPERPGDAYSLRHTGGEILARHGFTLARTDHGGDEHWVRPGKEARDGTSATVYADDGHTTIWSDTVTGMWPAVETSRPYDPYGLYAAIEHAGSFSAAGSALRALGYGSSADEGEMLSDLIADTTTKERALDAALPAPVEPWPEPRGLPQVSPLAPWPDGVLPAWLERQAANVAASVQCPVDIPATFGLGALAVATLGRADVSPRPGRKEPVAMYLTVVAGVSEGKSPAHEIMLAPIHDYEERTIHAAHSAVAAEETERNFLEEQIKTLDLKIARGTEDTPNSTLKGEVSGLRAQLATRVHPPSGRLITADVTPERLATLMSTTGERIAVVSDEAGVLNIDRYGDKKRGSNLDLYLNGWNGGRTIVDRQNGQDVRLKRPLLAFVVGAQPEKWDRIMADEEFRERGLGARFMACRPPVMADRRDDDLDRNVWDAEVDAEYVARMGDYAARVGAWASPATIVIGAEGRTAWSGWARGITERIQPGGDLDHEIGWVSKLKSSTLRLAAVLWLADGQEHGAEVDADTVLRACQMGDYWIAHRLIGAEVQAKGARRLLGALIRLKDAAVARNPRATPPFVARREVGRKGPLGLRTIDQIAAPVQTLIEAGLIRLLGVDANANMQVSAALRAAVGIEVHPRAAEWLGVATPRDTARHTPGESNEIAREGETVARVACVAVRHSENPPSCGLDGVPAINPRDTRDTRDGGDISCNPTHDSETRPLTPPPTIEDPTVFDFPTPQPTEHP